ncbi:MAG: hypothetical protein ACLQVM_30615 [Terriglobia bacterium]
MKNPVLSLLLGCVVSASFVGWRIHAMRSQPVNHFELLLDPSGSYTGGCESIVGSAEEVLRQSNVSASSTLTVLVLGDDSTAHEPRLLANYSIPTNRKVIEGKLAAVRRRESILEDIRTKCNSVRPTLISPVFLGVKQAVADLRGHGCGAGSECELRVASDLEENAEHAIRDRIHSPRARKDPLPKPLDNTGIKVAFCGYAATAGPRVDPSGHKVRKAMNRDPSREDRLQEVWRGLFASPELVVFEPYCPQPSNLRAYETTVAPKRVTAGRDRLASARRN